MERSKSGTYSSAQISSARTLPAAQYVYAARGAFLAPTTLLETDGEYTVTVPLSAEGIVFSAVPLVTYGDTDGDGQFSLLDTLRILRAIFSEARFDVAPADMNGDFSLTVADALLSLRQLLN